MNESASSGRSGAIGGSSFHGPEGFTVHDVSDPRKPHKVAEFRAPAGVHMHKLRVVGEDILYVNSERLPEPALAVNDLDLVRALQQGSEGAYEILLSRFQQPVYNLALRLLNDTSDAADVVKAVEAASGAQTAWAALSSHARGEFLRKTGGARSRSGRGSGKGRLIVPSFARDQMTWLT